MLTRQHTHVYVLFLVAILLFAGTEKARLTRANWLSKTIYAPFISYLARRQTHIQLRGHNEELHKEIAQKNLHIIALQKQLSKINNTEINFETLHAEPIVADVIGIRGMYNERNLLINKGRMSGVRIDNPVINYQGIVAKVLTVMQNTAILIPADNQEFKVPVLTKRKRIQGMLENHGTGNTVMTLIPLGSDISIGDTILTSNLSSVFPPNIPVGYIERISDTEAETYSLAVLRLFADVKNTESAIVLTTGE